MPRQMRVAQASAPASEVQTSRPSNSESLRSSRRSKLSVNVNYAISERLRNLAYSHRLSESSIVEIALAMFYDSGDDDLLGVTLRQLGATRRSK